MFFISTLNDNGEYGPRCIGFTHRLDDAIKAILDNVCDIHEQTFTYALIEDIEEGLYPNVVSEKWFEWTDDGYHPIDKPEQFRQYGNFAIG